MTPTDTGVSEEAGLTSEANAVLTLKQRIDRSSDASEKRYLGMILRRLEATCEERDAMKAALGFYADDANWKAIPNSEAKENQTVGSSWLRVGADIGYGFGPVLKDGGSVARAALSAEAPGRKEEPPQT